MLEIFLYEVALLVHCPVCEAGDVGLAGAADPCWEEGGAYQLDFPHDERIEEARKQLEAASAMVVRP